MGCVLAEYRYEVVYKIVKHHGNADAEGHRQYDDESPKDKDSEADDPSIDSKVHSVDLPTPIENKEYILHFLSEIELPQVSHLKTSCNVDLLSELICAIDAYQQMGPWTICQKSVTAETKLQIGSYGDLHQYRPYG